MTTIKFFCHSCQTFRHVEIEPVAADELNQEAWGDIVCGACHFVIATISGDPGVYQIVRVEAAGPKDVLGDVLERGMPK